MGLAKRRLEAQQEAGFFLSGPWRGVCPACIEDEALKAFVASHADIERCDFCSSESPTGVGLEELFEYMAECLAAEWDDPVNEVGWNTREGGWQGTPVIDSYELLLHLEGPFAASELDDVFAGAFEHEWCQLHPYSAAAHERLGWSWRGFSDYVKNQVRYLFLRTGRAIEPDPERIDPSEFLDELGRSITEGGLLRRLDGGTTLYRGRQHDPDRSLTTAADLGSPPPGGPWANRMSPPGISMFYGAEDVATVLAELRPGGFPRAATVGTWITARPLTYLDLVDVEVPSLFSPARHQRPWLRFLRQFADEVAEPVAADAGPVDYVPTQIVTEYMRHELRDDGGEAVRGIRYRSAARPEGISWVLFVDAAGCCAATPGWDADDHRWLALDPSSLQHFELGWDASGA